MSNNSDFSYSIGECGLCGQGALLICVDRSIASLFIFCNECESQWESPESYNNGDDRIPSHQEYTSIKDAFIDEISEEGWAKFISEKIPSDYT